MQESEKRTFCIREIILLIISFLTVGIGGSLSLKAAIGVSAWDALTQSLSILSGIKVGTLGFFFNASCVLGEIIILRKHTKWTIFCQIPIALILGVIVNFVYYDILGEVTLNHYWMKVIILFVAFICICLAVSMIMALDLITFPLEGFSLVFANHFNLKFGQVRQSIDVIALALVIIFTLLFKIPLYVREGTIFMALMFGPVLGWLIPQFKNKLYQWRFQSNKDYIKVD